MKDKLKMSIFTKSERCYGYPVSFRVGARLDRHYSIFKQRVTSRGSFVI